MNQPLGLPPRSIRVEVSAAALAALADALAPALERFVAENTITEVQLACAMQAYAGSLTAISGMKVDGAATIENHLPSFILGWHWGRSLTERNARGEDAGRVSEMLLPRRA
jgi:hypothetical protein